MCKDILYAVHYANYCLLNEVDRICKLHKINYYIWGGTMLGAVRHKDFIPWDDDVDVVFKRPEYEKFLGIVERELGENFEFVRAGQNGIFFDAIHKINYKHSQLREKNDNDDFYDNLHNKVSLDLFVLDNAGKGFEYSLKQFRLKMIYGYAMHYRKNNNYSQYSFFQKIQVEILKAIGGFFSMEMIMKKYEKAMKMGSDKSDEYIISNDRLVVINQKYKKSWFENRVYMNIRNTSFPVAAHYDDILKYIYGEYMKLPPEEKRFPKHIDDIKKIQVYKEGVLVQEQE